MDLLILAIFIGLLVLAFATPNNYKHPTHFFITAVKAQEDAGVKRWHDTRCWGYVPTQKEADNAVLKNVGDIHEMNYNFVIIEKMTMGVMSCPSHLTEQGGYCQWFKWIGEDGDEGHYEKCITPKWAENIVGWSIG